MRVARLWARGQLRAPLRHPPDSQTTHAADADHIDDDDTAAALALVGLRLDGDAGPANADGVPLYLWPENWPVWCLWRDLETQWRTGMGGATGLDYPSVWLLVEQRFKRRERKTVFWLVQAMEEVTLQEWRERDEKRAAAKGH